MFRYLIFPFPPIVQLIQSPVCRQEEAINKQRCYNCEDQLWYDDFLCVIKKIQPVADQKTEHVNIQVVDQFIDQTHDQRQIDIVLIVILGADAVEIADVDEQQCIKTEGAAEKQIQ